MSNIDVTASNWRQVEVGRVVFFGAGPFTGRIAAIVEIIDHKRVLVEGPSAKSELAVPRHAAPLSSVSLTSIIIPKLPRASGAAALKKQWESAEVDSKWTNGSFAKRLEKSARRKQLSDFERFKVTRLRKQARFEVRKAIAQAKA